MHEFNERRGRQNGIHSPITRRQLLRGAGAAAIAGSVAAVTPALAHDGPEHHSTIADVLPTPSPIPGGVTDPAAGFLHWFLPGPPTATTPFIGLPGFGLDAEPSMITNYHGFTAFAVISGQAWGSDGKQYNCEFDVRVMQGEYVAADGSHNHGTFGFFWVDLFDPGSGSQVHDLTPGIMPNGLFWTMQIPDHAFKVRRNGRTARLRLKNLPLVETFVFNGPLGIASRVDINIVWRSTSDFEERGFGNTVAPTDQGAFKGHFAESDCTGYVSGWETGFSFGTDELSSDTFFAEQGYEKNGVFL